MKKYRVTFKHGAWVVLETYLWAALVYVTWGILAPVAIWRIATRIAERAVIVDADEAKVTVSQD